MAEPETVWHGDTAFTAEERVEVERGIAWLNEQAGQPPIAVSWTYEVTSSQPLPRTIRRERGPGDESGRCRGQTVYLDPVGRPGDGMRPEYLAGLAAHEFAHCTLGLKDDPESDGIMRVLYPLRWTEREQQQM